MQRPILTEIERKLSEQPITPHSALADNMPRPVSDAWLGNAPETTVAPFTAQSPALMPSRPGLLQRWRQKGGVLGGIASAIIAILKIAWPVLAFISKLKYLALVGKLLLTSGSMLLSAWAYSLRFGWAFGAGLVALIFIHECGHALAARLNGIKTGIMVFIPFMGAFVTADMAERSLTLDAFIGIMGPVVGTLASVLCALIYLPTHNPFWLALASWGFFVNLFNLLPTPPLDGGWITPLFSPKLLAVGMILAVIVGFKNSLIWLLLLASLPRIVGGWKADPATQPYYQVATVDKWKYGFAYVGLATFLGAGSWYLDNFLTNIHATLM